MKKQIAKISILTLCAAAILAMPALSRAQDTTTNAPAAQTPPVKKKHNGALPFHGNLAAVDTNAMTLTVGNLKLQITSDTKITKDGQPAELGDGVVGQPVSGSYKKTDDGTLNAGTIHFGAKAAKRKKAAAPATGN